MNVTRPDSDRSLEDQFEIVPPRADAMVESMRSFGYTLEAAVADLVDNSIFAGARSIWIEFHWDGKESAIVVKDDGRGMNESSLIEAMRPGSVSPREARAAEDLGRFGLGLKTASFSQCRLTTVRSKHKGKEFTRAWDLDYVSDTKEWRLRKKGLPETEPYLRGLEEADQGTMVIWQHLDRVVDQVSTGDDARNHFLEKAEIVERHLAMTFHRFLQGPNRIRIHINDLERDVEPWDPFLQGEKATQELSREALEIFGKSLTVRPFVLPHKTLMSSPAVHDRAAGPRGWNAQQGFYVYRNRRLIIAGGWLDLRLRQEEHCKLARILVDLPNSMDEEWQIDITKAHATPPPSLVRSLRRIARLTRKRASEVYRHRGQVIRRRHATDYQLVWRRRVVRAVGENKIMYVVNREHPLIVEAQASNPEARDLVRMVVDLVENTLPIGQILVDNAEEPDALARPETWESPLELQRRGVRLFEAFVHDGLSVEDAYQRLVLTEPFDRAPQLLAMVEERLTQRGRGLA